MQRLLFKTPYFLMFDAAKWALDEYMKNDLQQYKPGDLHGWTKVAFCPLPVPATFGTKAFTSSLVPNNPFRSYANGCLGGQAPGIYDWPPPIGPNTRSLLKQHMNLPARGTAVEVWERTSNTGSEAPEEHRWYISDPHVAPELSQRHYQYLPINKPAPVPIAIPSNKRRDDPLGNDERSNKEPGAETKTGASNQYIVPHKPTKVGTRTKERKFSAAPNVAILVLRYLSRLKENLTELNDFLDVVLEAMPKDLQKVPHPGKRFANPSDKLKHIYDNFDRIDWGKAIEEFVKNQIEDRLVGAAIGASDSAARKSGHSSNLANRGAWLQKPQNFAPFNW